MNKIALITVWHLDRYLKYAKAQNLKIHKHLKISFKISKNT